MNPTLNPTDAVEHVAKVSQAAGLDPTVQMILVLAGLMLVLAYPLMLLVRTWQANRNSAKTESAVADGDEATYKRMKEQIEQNAADIRKLVDEKNKWFEEATILRAEVAQLRQSQDLVEVLKRKLQEKDDTIAKRDAMIESKDQQLQEMMERVLKMQSQIHSLEMRLTKDERFFCNKSPGCPRKGAGPDDDGDGANSTEIIPINPVPEAG